MGIYIKGMEMPVSCWYCDPDFAYAINCNEWKRDDFPYFTTSRPDTCPLTESAEAVDCTEFILWILDEIMDEENWELNAVANGEIIARKLKKLGLLEVKDGYYVRTPSADRPTGEWRGEHKMPDMPRYEWYRCSECSFLSQSVVNYCPNCGADMRGEER